MSDSLSSHGQISTYDGMSPLPASPPLQPGQQVGRFTLKEFLGEGGMGSVWAAVDPGREDPSKPVDPKRKDARSDGRVVLKFLRDDIRRCPKAMEDFRAAYRRTQKLTHQHICPLLDLGEDGIHGVFQVMHFINGMTLQQWLKQQDPLRSGLPVEQVVDVLRPVADALDYAHQESLVHRDIKPGNIMVELRDGKVIKTFVVDFGLAAEVWTTMSRHSQSAVKNDGTEPYMAPEQWRCQAQDSRTDQYSLAVVAWQMLTGQLPYQGRGEQLRFAVINDPISDLSDSLQHLQPVFSIALAKDRKQRYGSPIEFIRALSNAREGDAPATASTQKDDFAELLKKTQESFTRKHAQAKQLLQEHRYGDALKILGSIPEHLRDTSLFTDSMQKRDRIKELELTIREAVENLRLGGLRGIVKELLKLQPHRDDLRRLLEQCRPGLLVAPFDAKQAHVAQEEWAEYLGIGVELTNGLGMKFRVIPPRTFEMGDERTHAVTITQPKLLGLYPVTQGEWTKLMGSNPSHFKIVKGQDTSRFPVEGVNWEDCQTFLKKLNLQHRLIGWHYRLPTEAEWEYGCRAGTVTPYWFGGELNLLKDANCEGDSLSPSVVGSYGANPFGLYDQHGNVWEWCQDMHRHGDFASAVNKDPARVPCGSCHVLRGGSWDSSPDNCCSASRNIDEPSGRNYDIGVRLLCELF